MGYLKDFQKKHGLIPDGILGKKTFEKMVQVFKVTPMELVFFLGQVDHETGGFRVGEENLNYSQEALLRVFPKYFNTDTARDYARKPKKIASRVYANRMGNGSEETGDGWKHRGMGSIQLTGKNNQERFAQKVRNLKIIDNPEIIKDEYFFESGLFYFNENNLWKYCKEYTYSNILKLSKAVNLGNANSKATPNGLKDRMNKTAKYKKIYDSIYPKKLTQYKDSL